MTNDAQLNWLLSQGLIPLFGASIVYLIWGVFKKLVAPGAPYRWREAFDSMGWIYGAIVIVLQSAARCFEAGSSYRALGISCAVCAMLGGMLLLAAMSERGTHGNWQPPVTFKIMALIFVATALTVGYLAQVVPK
ncbi:MAG TPA: hypothetical protein VFX55_01075 [Duganella sp.]|nr:hypothetical protein [Duganella sp.]